MSYPRAGRRVARGKVTKMAASPSITEPSPSGIQGPLRHFAKWSTITCESACRGALPDLADAVLREDLPSAKVGDILHVTVR